MQALEPEYELASNLIKTHHPLVVVGKVNGDNEQDLLERYSVEGCPTLMWFNKGQSTAVFMGEATR